MGHHAASRKTAVGSRKLVPIAPLDELYLRTCQAERRPPHSVADKETTATALEAPEKKGSKGDRESIMGLHAPRALTIEDGAIRWPP